MAPLAGPDRPFGEEEAFCELEDLRVRRHDRVDRGVVADHLHVYLVRGHGDRSGNGRPVELEPREAHPDVVRGGVREGSVDAEDRELDLLPRPRVARHHQSVGSVPALHHRAPALAEGAADLAVDPHLGVIVERCLEHDRRPRRVEAPDLVGHGQRGPVPGHRSRGGGAPKGSEPRGRQLLVLLRGRRAAHADAAHHLAVHRQRKTALERREVGERGHGGATLADHLLEEPGRLLEQDRGARLSDRDLGAGGKGPVQALDRHEMAALVDHGEHPGGPQPPGLRGRGRDHGLGPFEGERLPARDLGHGRARAGPPRPPDKNRHSDSDSSTRHRDFLRSGSVNGGGGRAIPSARSGIGRSRSALTNGGGAGARGR